MAMYELAACMAPQVTEAQLADLFKDSGKVVDCRVCGDPNSAMRFAFIEFAEDDAVQRVRKTFLTSPFPGLSVRWFVGPCFAWSVQMLQLADMTRWWTQAIKLNGTVLGLYPLRVMQSKTAIVPVNTEFLPRTQACLALLHVCYVLGGACVVKQSSCRCAAMLQFN